jgi:hypothetical protein
MKVIKILAGIAFEIFAICVAIAILSAGETKFENVVLASLVQIYCVLRGIGLGVHYFFATAERSNLARFVEVLSILDRSRTADLASELREADDTISRKNVSMCINIGGLVVISIASLLELLHAVM